MFLGCGLDVFLVFGDGVWGFGIGFGIGCFRFGGFKCYLW